MTTQMFLDRFMVSSGGDTILHDGGAAAPKLDSKNRASNKLMVNSMARERILPRALQPGDKIAVLSPAGPVSEPESLKQGLRRLQSWGFSPKLSAHAKARNGYLAGSDRQRAADLQDAIDDKSVRAVVCSRGGYGTMRSGSLKHIPKPLASMLREGSGSDRADAAMALARITPYRSHKGDMPKIIGEQPGLFEALTALQRACVTS